jgi:hypothetical protein
MLVLCFNEPTEKQEVEVERLENVTGLPHTP